MKAPILLLSLLFPAALHLSGQSYWQQEVHTRISVRLDDETHFLHGYEEMDYINHSPDTLRYIYIHLWPNAYRNDRTAFSRQQVENGETDFYFSDPKDRGYIDSLSFTVGGQAVELSGSEAVADIARIDLPEPLPPGQQLRIATPFRVKLPKVFSRLGHNRQAYFISQWFPKPAVYDRKGWHPMSYLDLGEFYSEIGSYEVSITLPQNYIVMATGNCLDASENAWLDSLAQAPLPPDTLYRKGWPASSPQLKTIRFREENIHDFAWFADKRWVVRKDTALVPGSGEPVTLYTAFLPAQQQAWKDGLRYLKATLQHYGAEVGPYPYQTIKAVEGDMNAGGGMEYPTVTVIDRGATPMLRKVLIHEAGHNWFYGILASNERDHAWMDEGLNSFYDQKTAAAVQHGDTSLMTKMIERFGDGLETLLYYQKAASRTDQAIALPSADFTYLNYGLDVYYKTALMLRWLEQYMGPDTFRAAMRDYYDTWKFRHPYPEDFRAVLERHTDKPLDWFFEGALRTDQPVDFRIRQVRRQADFLLVTVKNKSDITAPVGIEVWRGDSLTASVWSQPFSGTTTLSLPVHSTEWSRLRVTEAIPDIKPANSIYRRGGPFHKSGLKPGIGLGTNRAAAERIWLLPAVGYNLYDGSHVGLLIHNLTFPESRFRLALAPLYSTASETFTGAGSVGYFFYPKKIFHNILLQTDVKSFHYMLQQLPAGGEPLRARYRKVAPALHFTFREREARSPVQRVLTLKAYSISEEEFLYPNTGTAVPSINETQRYFTLLQYRHSNDRTFNPFSYRLEAQTNNKNFIKASIEGRIRVDYDLKNKGLHLRAFAGKFITLNSVPPSVTNRYWFNTTYTGVNDYLYDDVYMGRTETTGISGARISALREGGFKVPTNRLGTPLGRSDDWLAALNVETDIPWVPLRLFLDVGSFADAPRLNPNGNKLVFNGGLALHLLPGDRLSIYLPLIMSRDFREYQESLYGKKRLLNSIVFSIQLHDINWLRLPSALVKKIGR